jgi:putative acetyltransferase
MVTVRDAEPDDAETVAAAHVAAIEELGPAAYDDAQVAAWAERPGGADPYREQARDEDHTFVVGEQGSHVVGFGHLVPPGKREEGREHVGEVRAVYVHGEHVRDGVGTALLEHLEAAARERGLRSLELTASMNAVGFYERHGFERVEETVHETTGGVALAVVVMRKVLDGRG